MVGPSAAPRPTAVAFSRFDASAFARAKREGKLVLLDGAAEWCHWCHVMDAQTYADARVAAALAQAFVATRVDIDERPDIQERYADYGWPATILFSAEGAELGAYKGFLPPERLLAALDEARSQPVAAAASSRVAKAREGRGALDLDALAIAESDVRARMGAFYDPKEGGWGTFQKAPLGWNNAALLREAPSSPAARAQALFTLERQAQLIDPVWGGIYQYSDGGTWDRPHFEKLMTFQAIALENYAEAYALTKDPRMFGWARAMKRYLSEFLRRDGLFGATQDADLNAHDSSKTFLDGHSYYALGDKERRALGQPRVEWRAYPRENGLAMAAFAAYAEHTGDESATRDAIETAKKLLASHRASGGGLAHEPGGVRIYLADNAHVGFALVRLFERTREPWLLAEAEQIAARMDAELWDDAHGGYCTYSRDPAAVGVFQARRMPLDENAFAVRFLVRLAEARGRDPKLHERVARALYAVLTKENLDDRGRMLGEVLLAVSEARALFAPAPPKAR